MRHKVLRIVEQLARGWRMPDVRVTWLQLEVEWILLSLGGTK